MKTIEANADLSVAAKNAAAGVVDPNLAAEACRHMDDVREELRKRTGDLNIAVDLIREVREE